MNMKQVFYNDAETYNTLISNRLPGVFNSKL